jgi:hypothetical protein
MKPYYKEYNFTDWINFWRFKERYSGSLLDSFEPEIGEKTRNLILDEFIRSIGEGFYLCEFGYFAHYVIGIITYRMIQERKC